MPVFSHPPLDRFALMNAKLQIVNGAMEMIQPDEVRMQIVRMAKHIGTLICFAPFDPFSGVGGFPCKVVGRPQCHQSPVGSSKNVKHESWPWRRRRSSLLESLLACLPRRRNPKYPKGLRPDCRGMRVRL